MTQAHALLFWFRTSFKSEDRLLRRMDDIRGYRLDWSSPSVSAFSMRKVASAAG